MPQYWTPDTVIKKRKPEDEEQPEGRLQLNLTDFYQRLQEDQAEQRTENRKSKLRRFYKQYQPE